MFSPFHTFLFVFPIHERNEPAKFYLQADIESLTRLVGEGTTESTRFKWGEIVPSHLNRSAKRARQCSVVCMYISSCLPNSLRHGTYERERKSKCCRVAVAGEFKHTQPTRSISDDDRKLVNTNNSNL